MTKESTLIVNRDDEICTIVINNPERRNALTPACLTEISQTFEALSQDDTIRVVIVRGAGEKAFSSGADISKMPSKESGGSPRDYKGPTAASEAIQRYPYPSIAMLNGYTLGAGCILAMACDIRIAATNVSMGIPTSRMGVISSYPVFRRFLTVLGYGTALEMFLTGRFYKGRECLEMGMVNHMVESDRLESFTYEMAKEILACAPLSLRGSKFILNKIAGDSAISEEDLETFQSLSIQAVQSEDHEEAKRAFMEKRKARFKGR